VPHKIYQSMYYMSIKKGTIFQEVLSRGKSAPDL
jgi:hypothetical protein